MPPASARDPVTCAQRAERRVVPWVRAARARSGAVAAGRLVVVVSVASPGLAPSAGDVLRTLAPCDEPSDPRVPTPLSCAALRHLRSVLRRLGVAGRRHERRPAGPARPAIYLRPHRVLCGALPRGSSPPTLPPPSRVRADAPGHEAGLVGPGSSPRTSSSERARGRGARVRASGPVEQQMFLVPHGPVGP